MAELTTADRQQRRSGRRSLPAEPSPMTLAQLADRVRQLAPNRHDPEQFHADKKEIEAALRWLAREAEER